MCHRNQGLGGESLSGFNPPLSVRLTKDITSPHKPSSGQEILERALLWVKGWYPQCWQLQGYISNQTTDTGLLSTHFQVLNAKSSALPSSLSCLALPDSLLHTTGSPCKHPHIPESQSNGTTEKPKWEMALLGLGCPTHHHADIIKQMDLWPWLDTLLSSWVLCMGRSKSLLVRALGFVLFYLCN